MFVINPSAKQAANWPLQDAACAIPASDWNSVQLLAGLRSGIDDLGLLHCVHAVRSHRVLLLQHVTLVSGA